MADRNLCDGHIHVEGKRNAGLSLIGQFGRFVSTSASDAGDRQRFCRPMKIARSQHLQPDC